MADYVLESLERAVSWLDMHFIIPSEDIAELAHAALNTSFSRLDSKVIRDVAAIIVKPC